MAKPLQTRPRFKRSQIIRLERLMNMMYTPGEIAEEIGISRETIWSDYLQAGLPHKKLLNHIWINGIDFKRWALEIHRLNTAPADPMDEIEAVCFRCRKRVTISDPRIEPFGKVALRLVGTCPNCGTKLNRAIKGSQKK